MGEDKPPTGLTKDVGFQIGVRRTLPVSHDEAWAAVTSEAGVALWLGSRGELRWEKGASYERSDGSVGEVRVYKPGSHVRVTWQPPGWERASTIQVRVIPSGERTVVAFHQEHLPGEAEREQQRAHFQHVLNELEGPTAPKAD